MTIYLKAGEFQGDVSTKGYETWVELQSLYFNIEAKSSMPVGSRRDRNRGAPEFSEALLSKSVDRSSNDFFHYSCTNKVLSQVEIHVCAMDKTLAPIIKHLLYNVMIARYEALVGAQGLPVDQVLLNYTKIESTYMGRNVSNAAVSPRTSGYNLETAEVL